MAIRVEFPRNKPSANGGFGHSTFGNMGAGVGRSKQGPEYLLLPANPLFIWGTLLLALGVNMLPWGRMAWLPDFLAIALVFWNVQQPRRVGIGAAFLFGLIMDVHSGALLGQHALAYTLLSYLAMAIRRRIVWFSLSAQSLHVLPIFITAQLLMLLVRLLTGGQWPGLGYVFAPFLEAALWPLVTLLLLAPQRRPIDTDKNRPVL